MKVHAWPQDRASLKDADGLGLLLISVATPNTAIRDTARMQIRNAVRDAMALRLDVPVETINLITVPGEPPRLKSGSYSASLSISHEPGLSVAAIHSCGSVGIDIMRVDSDFDWRDVAKDYLEREAVHDIMSRPLSAQACAFANEWTRLEARLKCLGKGLTERSDVRDAALQTCQTRPVPLPQGFVGHVAWLDNAILLE